MVGVSCAAMEGERFRTRAQVAESLRMVIDPQLLSWRQDAGSLKVPYLTGATAVSVANEVFGFDGWSFSIVSDIHVEERKCARPCARPGVGREGLLVQASVRVRVTLAEHLGGIGKEEQGYGIGWEDAGGYAKVVEMVRKTSVTDGMKRALKMFGYGTGGCLGDKRYVAWARKVGMKPIQEMFQLDHVVRLNRRLSPGVVKEEQSFSPSLKRTVQEEDEVQVAPDSKRVTFGDDFGSDGEDWSEVG